MCCDFFYPRLGGVEMHIFSLAQALLAAGLRVCVVTNAYSAEGSSSTHASTGVAGVGARARRQRVGVRVMARGLRVYHLPLPPMAEQTVLPTFTAGFPLLRKVLLRERVSVVHGHAATSVLMHECLLQARTMGVRCVFTDHSLFSFHDFVGIVGVAAAGPAPGRGTRARRCAPARRAPRDQRGGE
jgi:phosphatidylinositol glycan class A protein